MTSFRHGLRFAKLATCLPCLGFASVGLQHVQGATKDGVQRIPPPPNFVDISFQLFLRETMHKGTKVHFAVFDFHRGIAHVTSGTEGPVRPPFLQRAIRESHRRCAQHVQHLHFVSDITRRPRGLWQNWLPCVHGNLFRFLVK